MSGKQNVARETLWPNDPDILVRVAFLYVGQGASAIVLAADGANSYKSLLLDINLDSRNGGIDVPAMVTDLLDGADLDVFMNSHPHDDHLRGVTELHEAVNISEVWHSGHVPGKNHKDSYDELKKVIDSVGSDVVLKGSRSSESFGEASCHILAPAEYVSDELADEDAEERYRRIHEQCAVIKFGIDGTWIMIPGDADRAAFENHITEYHEERLEAVVLAAPHHGSRSFFKKDEDDDPYLDALEKIDPDYVVISAPKQSESKHDHPHDDAVELYEDNVGQGNVLHTGEKRHSFICDIYRDGSWSGAVSDDGVLAETYALESNGSNGGKGAGKMASVTAGGAFGTRIDDRPMGE